MSLIIPEGNIPGRHHSVSAAGLFHIPLFTNFTNPQKCVIPLFSDVPPCNTHGLSSFFVSLTRFVAAAPSAGAAQVISPCRFYFWPVGSSDRLCSQTENKLMSFLFLSSSSAPKNLTFLENEMSWTFGHEAFFEGRIMVKWLFKIFFI